MRRYVQLVTVICLCSIVTGCLQNVHASNPPRFILYDTETIGGATTSLAGVVNSNGNLISCVAVTWKGGITTLPREACQ